MKLRNIRYFSIAALASVLLAGCAALQSMAPVSKAQSTSAAQRVISAYHVSRLLAQADGVLTHSLLAKLPDNIAGAKRQQVRRVIDDAFQVRALTRSVRDGLVQQADSAGHAHALVEAATALESPLASRMLGLQSEAGDEGFAKKYNAFLQQPLDAQAKARLAQIRTLMHNMGIIEAQSAFQLSLLKTMVATRNAMTSAKHDIDKTTLQQLLDKNRSTLRNQMQEQVPLLLLYIYRNIDDKTLSSYVKLQSSPALQWINQALVKAIRGALESAGQTVPRQVASLGRS